ncbi:MAG: hypothetical protein HN522_05120, partial [Flavobacteriales bacterium]|nr:hypothetical protein [Flavobacteriales bacterium]
SQGVFRFPLSELSTTGINDELEINENRKLLRIVDILGRETTDNKDEVLFYIYDDGTVEKKIIIE